MSSSAYPWKPNAAEIMEEKKWAGMYFAAHKGKVIVEYAQYGMSDTIVHEVAHAIDFEVLGISGLPESNWKPTRVGRDFTKFWKSHLAEFSEYGQTDVSEGFATAMTSYLSTPYYMRDKKPVLYKWFQENIGKSNSERRWDELVQQNKEHEKMEYEKKKQITENQSKGVF